MTSLSLPQISQEIVHDDTSLAIICVCIVVMHALKLRVKSLTPILLLYNNL